MRLEKNLHHILRRKAIKIRTSGMSSIKNLLLGLEIRNKTTINSKNKVKSIMFSSNQKLLGELSYQSIVVISKGLEDVTNFIQLISPQPVDRFSQTKLLWKAPNEGYPHICGMYKSNNE